MTSYKMARMNRRGRPWPEGPGRQMYRDPLVCQRCGKLMRDCEPGSPYGEFYHQRRAGITCVNDGKTFYLDRENQLPELPKEVAVFERKRIRRATKRARINARRARKKAAKANR